MSCCAVVRVCWSASGYIHYIKTTGISPQGIVCLGIVMDARSFFTRYSNIHTTQHHNTAQTQYLTINYLLRNKSCAGFAVFLMAGCYSVLATKVYVYVSLQQQQQQTTPKKKKNTPLSFCWWYSYTMCFPLLDGWLDTCRTHSRIECIQRSDSVSLYFLSFSYVSWWICMALMVLDISFDYLPFPIWCTAASTQSMSTI